jgi:hypothetical protein
MDYILEKVDKQGSKEQVRFENIMHMICKEDNLYALQTYLRRKEKAFYVKCPYSPLVYLKVRTGIEFME